MSRISRLNRTIRRAEERRVEKIEPKKPPLRGRIVKFLAFLIGIPGVLAALLSLLPRVTSSISAPVDPDNAMSALATVTNTGFIPLDSVELYLGVDEFCPVLAHCSAPDFPDPRRDYPSRFRRKQWLPHDTLNIDEQVTFPLDDIMRAELPGQLVYADIAIIVVYKIPIIRLTREKVFPLYTRKATNGKLYWQWK